MNRQQRLDIAAETVRIVETGHYTAANGRRNDIAADVAACVAATQLFQPADLQSVQARMLAEPATATAIRIEVVNETTLEGVAALLAQGDAPLAALNFASARQPGGGFLSGAQAQEESLARSSALYASLQRAPQYYEQHRRSPSLLYTDAMILSPQCPVFRDDAGHLLPQAQRVSFITAAAPNAGAIADNRPDELPLIAATLQRRAAYVLALAAAQGYRRLVLGAWGCGVFRNDPQQVAGVFAQLLQGPARPGAGVSRRCASRCWTHRRQSQPCARSKAHSAAVHEQHGNLRPSMPPWQGFAARKTAMRLTVAATLLLGMASASAQSTKWTEKSVPDPILPGAKCEVAMPGTFGSAIYEAPSKFDQVFWPITSPDGIWFCRQSGFAAFVGDFDGIDVEQRSAIAGFLASSYKAQRRRPELAELLTLLEGCYVQRRLAPRQQITVLRALAYQHEQMGNLSAAESRRSEALDLILEQLEGDALEPPQRLEYLFVASVYSRWFRENGESANFLKQLRDALKHADAAVPESYAKYLRELVKDVPRVRAGGRLAPGSD